MEPNPNPNIPDHLTAKEVCSSFDRDDPDRLIFRSIQDNLNDVLNNVTPSLGSCYVNYGTIQYGPLDSEFDPVLHPKVLSVEMEPRSIERWEEKTPPPFRYYIGGAEFCSSKAAIAPMSDVSTMTFLADPNKLADAPHPTQPFQQRVHIGHSIGKEGAQRDSGTMCCVLRLVDDRGHLLPDMYGLTCRHVVSDDGRPLPIAGVKPQKMCAPALWDVSWRITETYEKMQRLQKEVQAIQSSRVKYPADKIRDWNPVDKQRICGRQGTESKLAATIRKLEQDIQELESMKSRLFLGEVAWSSGFEFTEEPSPNAERQCLDWALIKLNNQRVGSNQEPVFKYGRTIGTTDGIVKGFTFTKLSGSQSIELTIKSTSPDRFFCWNGDSGSAVINARGQFVGMIIGKSLLPTTPTVGHKTFFTGRNILFKDIEKRTGYGVTWVAPVDLSISEANLSNLPSRPLAQPVVAPDASSPGGQENRPLTSATTGHLIRGQGSLRNQLRSQRSNASIRGSPSNRPPWRR
ncbi:MAG: hypothetical protein Q9171_002441 [Xanthocarpia ochracea]